MKKIRETFVHLVGIFLFGLVYGGGEKGKKKRLATGLINEAQCEPFIQTDCSVSWNVSFMILEF